MTQSDAWRMLQRRARRLRRSGRVKGCRFSLGAGPLAGLAGDTASRQYSVVAAVHYPYELDKKRDNRYLITT